MRASMDENLDRQTPSILAGVKLRLRIQEQLTRINQKMPISPADQVTGHRAIDLGKFEALVEKCLFRDALIQAQASHGPWEEWRLTELRFLAFRCLGHLGKQRSADAIAWRLARDGFESPEFIPYYLGLLFDRRGGVSAWEACRQLDDSNFGPREATRLLCRRAEIASFYRDFSRAEEFLLAARLREDNRVVRYYQAYLLYLQDQYQPALEQVLELLRSEPDYRSAIQLAAYLLQVTGDAQSAIGVLHEPAFRMQSVPVANQLFSLYLEAGDYDRAGECVTHIENLLLDEQPASIRLVNRLKSDLLCAQQRYADAIPYLELTSPFHNKVYASIKLNRDKITASELRRKVLGVPFVRQSHMTCAPASIAAVTAYLGRPVEQQVIANDISYDGTPAFAERKWLEQQGWNPVEFEMNYASVKDLIDSGFPILLATVEPGSAHLQVLVGYDESMNVLIMRDPNYPRLQEMLARESIEYYAADGPRCVVLADETRIGELDRMPLQARDLYDLYFRVNKALNENNPAAAADFISAMAEVCRDHRLTLEARRAFAIYEQNEIQVLTTTEALLGKFPNNVNLQLSKISSLSYLYSEARKRDYLETLCMQPDCHFLIKSRLAEELRFDEREAERTRKLLVKLLRQNSLHAATLFSYAGFLWSQREFVAAYEVYRFITCLEDKNEFYAASYFKAARFCKDADKALEFLYDRFNRYKHKSSGPAISLFNALDSLHRTQEGLEVLEDAMQALPGDGELLAFTAREYLYVGDLEKNDALMKRAAPLVRKTHYLELLAENCEMQQDREQALEYYSEILRAEPLHANAAASLVRLLREQGDDESAREFIDEQLSQHPDNYRLLRQKTIWAGGQDLDSQVDALRALLDHHPDQAWAYVELCRIHLQQFDTEKALQMIGEAIDRQPSEAEAHCVHGHVLVAADKPAEARAAYRRAIELSCDCTEAFQSLIELALDNDSQIGELEFIYQQLLTQVTHGEAILKFQEIASNWMTSEKLLEILNEANAARPDLLHSWLALAIQYRERDMLDLAMTTLDQAVARFPLVPRLKLEKAELYRLQEMLPQAEQELRAAMELAPGWATAGTRLSEILEAQGNFEAAIETLKDLIRAAPTEPTPHGYLASLLWRIGDSRQAIESIRAAIAIAPGYVWAWNRYHEWCRQSNHVTEIIAALERARVAMPANADLAITHSQVLENGRERVEVLEGFLQKYPRNLDVNIEYISLLVQQRNFSRALEVSDESKWGQKVPLAIRANHAWIRHVQGYVDDAILEMEAVVEQNPNYYDGWRYLTNWYSAKGDSAKVIESCQQCLKLYPNNPSVLCFVAEALIEHNSSDRIQIEKLLKRAYYLNPADQDNGLTYIDYLLDQDKLDEAQASIEVLERQFDNPYTVYRKLHLQCRKRDSDRALQYWQAMITDPATSAALVWSAWTRMQEPGVSKRAGRAIELEREKRGFVVPAAGEYLAYYIVENRGIRVLEKNLKSMPSNLSAFDHRVVEGYIRILLKQQLEIPQAILKKLHDSLRSDTTNWGLIAYLKTEQTDCDFIVNWMSNHRQMENVEAWMLYFYSVALRHTGKWNEGAAIAAEAVELPRDNYFHDLVVWSAFDSAIRGDFGMRDLLLQIDSDNLSDISRYVYVLTECLNELRDRGFSEAWESILVPLERIKTAAGLRYGSRVAWEASKRTRARIAQSSELPFFKGLIWRAKLGRYFR
jgi:cellulose synthase operon protein C